MPIVLVMKSALFVTTMLRSELFRGDGSEDEYTDKEVASADAIHTEKTGA